MKTEDSNLWEELYAAAVLETDPAKMLERIRLAQEAIRDRWQVLNQTPRANDRERRRVEDAMRTLNMIQQMELRASA